MSSSSTGSEVAIADWFASIYRQSEAAIAMIVDRVRRDGQRIDDYVIIAADVTDETTRFFVNQLGDVPLDPTMPGFVGAIPKETVARVLRVIDAENAAADVEKALDAGHMRVLIAARGQLQCADLPISPLMVKGGSS